MLIFNISERIISTFHTFLIKNINLITTEFNKQVLRVY